MVTYAYLLSPD